jgi:hypothetical protein
MLLILTPNSRHKIKPNQTGGFHQCAYCPKSFYKSYGFFLHSNKAHHELIAKEWVECEVCKMFLPNATSLKAHQNIAHAPKRILACDFCPEEFHTTKLLVQHANGKHIEKVAESNWAHCNRCNIYFPDLQSLKDHKHSEFRKKYKVTQIRCPICSQGFFSKDLCESHVAKIHGENETPLYFVCELCQINFTSKLLLRTHNLEHHDIHTCYICDKNFGVKSLYFDHANRIHKTLLLLEWVKCKNCRLFFPSQDELSEHTSTSCFPKSKPTKSIKSSEEFNNYKDDYDLKKCRLRISSDNFGSYRKCSDCNVFLPSKSALTRHVDKKHSEVIYIRNSRNVRTKSSRKQKRRRYVTESESEYEEYVPSPKKSRRKESPPKPYPDLIDCYVPLNKFSRRSKLSSGVHGVEGCDVRVFEDSLSSWHMCDVCFVFLPSLQVISL